MYECSKKLVRYKNAVVLTILAFRHIECLHLMYAEVAWVPVSSWTQVQSQVIVNPDYLPDYFFVSYDYVKTQTFAVALVTLIPNALMFPKRALVEIKQDWYVFLKTQSFLFKLLMNFHLPSWEMAKEKCTESYST